jgi:hypothetical protein
MACFSSEQSAIKGLDKWGVNGLLHSDSLVKKTQSKEKGSNKHVSRVMGDAAETQSWKRKCRLRAFQLNDRRSP